MASSDRAERDLSKVHEPVSDFLSLSDDVWPPNQDSIKKYALTEEQLVTFERDGYLTDLPLLNEAQVKRLLEELDELMNPDHPLHDLWYEFNANEAPGDSGKVLFHSLGAWRMTPAFHDVLFHPGVVIRGIQLLGGKSIRFWHDQLFCKPGKCGGGVSYHVDYAYWKRTAPMNHLTMHVALDPQSGENGAIQYVPGSHTWGVKDVTSLHFDDMDSIKTILTPEQIHKLDTECVTTKLPSGNVAIHHALTVHGSQANVSDMSRRATVVNLFADGTKCEDDSKPLLEGVPIFAKGQKLEGQFFPILGDPKTLESLYTRDLDVP